MRILISGSHGLIGQAVLTALTQVGHHPISLKRSSGPSTPDTPLWEPIHRNSWDSDIGPVDAVIHLAGENLAAHRWTPEVKHRLHTSRVGGTEQLCKHLASLEKKPGVFIAASAMGYYGNRGDEILTENSKRGEGYLSELCRDWEAACQPAVDAGIRVVNMRFGMVLAREGGALHKLLPIFKTGLGGQLGSGRQWMSWIALDDLVTVIIHSLTDSRLTGPVNVVSPNPVTNSEFTHTLAKVLKRPAFFTVPAFVLRAVWGEMADEMLLASTRVEPKKLNDNGLQFNYPDLETTLRHTILTDN
jgi:uncharacterized protein (TIGR01777 family)